MDNCLSLGFLRSRFQKEVKSAEDFLGNTLGVNIYGRRDGIRVGQMERLACNIASTSYSNKWLESLAILESVCLIVLLICMSPMTSGASQVALVVKNLPANRADLRDVGSIPGSGRSLGGGHGNPLQYYCLGNPMDRGA